MLFVLFDPADIHWLTLRRLCDWVSFPLCAAFTALPALYLFCGRQLFGAHKSIPAYVQFTTAPIYPEVNKAQDGCLSVCLSFRLSRLLLIRGNFNRLESTEWGAAEHLFLYVAKVQSTTCSTGRCFKTGKKKHRPRHISFSVQNMEGVDEPSTGSLSLCGWKTFHCGCMSNASKSHLIFVPHFTLNGLTMITGLKQSTINRMFWTWRIVQVQD